MTATGFDGVLGAEQLEQVADGAILVNVGHSDREIDVDWLDRHPRVAMRRHLDRYDVAGRRLHLLNRGSLVNLAAGLGIAAPQLFDPFAAIMLLGLDAILRGRTADLPAGVQRYPAELEARVARALIEEPRPDLERAALSDASVAPLGAASRSGAAKAKRRPVPIHQTDASVAPLGAASRSGAAKAKRRPVPIHQTDASVAPLGAASRSGAAKAKRRPVPIHQIGPKPGVPSGSGGCGFAQNRAGPLGPLWYSTRRAPMRSTTRKPSVSRWR